MYMLCIFVFSLGLFHRFSSFLFSEGQSPPTFRDRVGGERITKVNDTLKLICRAKGQPKPFLQWFYEDSPIDIKNSRSVHLHT